MIAHTKSNRSATDRGIWLNGPSLCSGDVGISHLTQLYVGLVLKSKPETKSKRTSRESQRPGDLGIWFEQAYLKTFIGEPRLKSNYLVAGGFTSKNPEVKYDVDMMILDRRRLKLFMIQVKYHRKYRNYRWDDELKDLFSPGSGTSGILRGVRQLSGVRSAINTRTIQDQIVNCFRQVGFRIKRDDISKDHVHYVLLHSVTSLDFAVIDGICLYEWNTFRSLLHGGTATRVAFRPGEIAKGTSVRESDVLALEDPKAVGLMLAKRAEEETEGSIFVPPVLSRVYFFNVKTSHSGFRGLFNRTYNLKVLTPSINDLPGLFERELSVLMVGSDFDISDTFPKSLCCHQVSKDYTSLVVSALLTHTRTSKLRIHADGESSNPTPRPPLHTG